jgi:hypothetical protein
MIQFALKDTIPQDHAWAEVGAKLKPLNSEKQASFRLFYVRSDLCFHGVLWSNPHTPV